MRARWLLYGVKGLGDAGVHKLLHHKPPHLCPLVGSLTLPLLKGRSWSGAQIHHDLRVNADQFAELERWFAELAALQGPENVPLSRLRLHDILMWLDAPRQNSETDQRSEAITAGGAFLR